MEEEHNMMVAAMDDWMNDGYELQDAVDQSKFEETYGFKYDSHRWDSYYNGVEQARTEAKV